MAKKRTKSSKPVIATVNASEKSIPLLNEEALHALTARIEKGLGGDNSKAGVDTITDRLREQGGRRSSSKPKQTSKLNIVELQRGTKRDANGNAKIAGKRSKDRNITENEHGNDDKAALLQEIMALGGTEEDMDLVADVASDDEVFSNTDLSLDPAFRKELAGFVSGLGIEKSVDIPEEDSADEAAWNSASEADVSMELGQRTEVSKKETTPTTQHTIGVPDKLNRLVSTVIIRGGQLEADLA
jgi:ribosome biogenesis protein MAK21